jgi:hypothetical protein
MIDRTSTRTKVLSTVKILSALISLIRDAALQEQQQEPTNKKTAPCSVTKVPFTVLMNNDSI